MSKFYFDPQNDCHRDQPLIFSCSLPGFARAVGMDPAPKHERVVDTFLTNTAMAGECDKALSYSRHKPFWKGHSRYRPRDFTYANAMNAVATIVNADLAIENRTAPGHRGRQSIIRATDLLMSHWGGMGEPTYDPAEETIILKSRDDQRLLPYPNSPAIQAMRAQAQTVNEMLTNTNIEVPDGITVGKHLLMFEKLAWDQLDRPYIDRNFIRIQQKAGRRIFSGDFRSHGRFYCAAQGIPSDSRQNMLINGERCAEYDFSSHHPRIAYDMAGLKMDGDPYDVGSGFIRGHVKLGVLTVFNAADRLAAIRALANNRDVRPRIPFEMAAKIVDAIFERHDPIRKLLCADIGIRLMNRDAAIMMAILEALVARGIPCIGIHDSVISPDRFGGQVRGEMEKFWAIVQNGINPCDVRRKTTKDPHLE